MTNFEKYRDELLELGTHFAVEDGKPVRCRTEFPCAACNINLPGAPCTQTRMAWLTAEAKEEQEIHSHVEAAVDVLNAIDNQPENVIKTNALCLIAFNTASIADVLEDIRDILGGEDDEQAD